MAHLTQTRTHDTTHSQMLVTKKIAPKTTSWPLPCTCLIARCTSLGRLYPNIMYIHGATQEQNCPILLAPNLAVQIIKFTLTHDRFTNQAIQTKQDKWNPLTSTTKEQEWTINPLIIVTSGVQHRSIHTQSLELLGKPTLTPKTHHKHYEKHPPYCP